MRQPCRLFFYGTLTHHHANPLTITVLPRLAGPPRRGWVRGVLYLRRDPLGVYPVLLPGPGRVTGWVYGGLRPVTRDVLAAFDAWEGHDPARPGRGEYRRVVLPVRTRSGLLRVSAYVPSRRGRAGLRRIPGGDFAAHAAARGLAVLKE